MSNVIPTILAFGIPGGYEWVIILVIALLLFGRRLPEVGRSLGRGIVEFKRGIKGISDEIEEESSQPTKRELPRESAQGSIPDKKKDENPYVYAEGEAKSE